MRFDGDCFEFLGIIGSLGVAPETASAASWNLGNTGTKRWSPPSHMRCKILPVCWRMGHGRRSGSGIINHCKFSNSAPEWFSRIAANWYNIYCKIIPLLDPGESMNFLPMDNLAPRQWPRRRHNGRAGGGASRKSVKKEFPKKRSCI